MSDARSDILGAVKRATGDAAANPQLARDFAARCAAPKVNLVPERGQGSGAALIDHFVAEAERATATVERLTSREQVPAAVAAYLERHALPAELKVSPALKGLDWAGQTALRAEFGRAGGDDHVGVSEAFAGIAETGTLVLLSGPETPATLNFLPDTHFVVLKAARIGGSYEDAWARLRQERGPDGFMPRVVNWITGPSRSADIELILLLGVHGPRRLHILLIDGEDT